MLTVIIPVRNASATLPGLLDSISSQTVRPAEILVLDTSSADGSAQAAESRGATVIGISPSEFDHAGTRNLAAQRAKGRILLFLTQDVRIADRKAFENLLEIFQWDSAVAAGYGRQLPHPGASLPAVHLRQYNYPEISHIRHIEDRGQWGLRTAFLSNSFAAYRKQDLHQIGYFQEGLIFGEDMEAAARLLLAGKKIAYAAKACVFHSHDYTLRQEFQRSFDMGVFHKTRQALLRQFGSAGKQGIRYVRSEFAFLAARRKYHLFWASGLHSSARAMGYQAGKLHRILPCWMNRRLSMNRGWWNKQKTSVGKENESTLIL